MASLEAILCNTRDVPISLNKARQILHIDKRRVHTLLGTLIRVIDNKKSLKKSLNLSLADVLELCGKNQAFRTEPLAAVLCNTRDVYINMSKACQILHIGAPRLKLLIGIRIRVIMREEGEGRLKGGLCLADVLELCGKYIDWNEYK